MLTQIAVCRGAPVNGGGTTTYVGNPKLSEEKTADGECTTAIISEEDYNAGWNVFRVETDTAVYVKIGSAATSGPRYLAFPGATLNIIVEKAEQNVFIAAA